MNLTVFNQTDHCAHFSCPERSVSSTVYILRYVSAATAIFLTVCGNLLVIVSVVHFKKLHTPTNMLVLSLAVSDFFVGAFVMPPMLIWIMESCWIFGREFCVSFWMIGGVLSILSIYNIALIAVDRYLALSNPFFYMNSVSVRIICIVIVLNWCVVVAYILVLVYFNKNFLGFIMCPGECFVFINQIWAVINIIYTFIIPLSVIITFYSRVFVIVKKHVTAIRDINNHTWSKKHNINSNTMKSERKAAKVLGILVAVFLGCLLPYFIYSLLGKVVKIQAEIFQRLVIVLYLNSTINPVIYALVYPWFRKCIKLFITLQIFQRDSGLIDILS